MNPEFNLTMDIIPHVGIGVLQFGRTRSDMRLLLGEPSKVFKKAPFADTLTDAYVHLGMHLFYDLKDCLESIDVFSPAILRFDGILLLGVPAKDIACEMMQRGYRNDSYVFEEAGFSLFVRDDIVESVTVFRKDCHDITDSNSQRSRVLKAAENWRRAK